jgi:FkbM family methyltransferase
MALSQFLNTVAQISEAESIGTFEGLYRHLAWESRRVFNRFPVELRFANSKLRVERPCGVAALVNAMGEYDYNNMRFLRLILSHRRGTFVDVGANIGVYTLLASEIQEVSVVSIEPHPITYEWLKQNVKLNGRENVKCLNLAISDHDGEIRFMNGPEPSINRIITKNEEVASTLGVECRRMETICTDLQIMPIVIKIDVEGHEYEVLEGLGSHCKFPKVIFVENGERRPINDWMRAFKFLGPFYVHINRMELSEKKQRRSEDPVYFRDSFLGELKNLGFSVSGPIRS